MSVVQVLTLYSSFLPKVNESHKKIHNNNILKVFSVETKSKIKEAGLSETKIWKTVVIIKLKVG